MFHMKHVADNIDSLEILVNELGRFVQSCATVKAFDSIISKYHGILTIIRIVAVGRFYQTDTDVSRETYCRYCQLSQYDCK